VSNENNTRVLVADDDQSIRQLLSTVVRRERLAVDSAADGQEAIDRLREHDYAVILLDLMMPRIDGFGVIEFLRNHPPEIKPVVLVITAYADQRFKKVDPDIVAGVIRKPFEIAELGNIIRLCVTGFDEEVAHHLAASRDSAIRKVATQLRYGAFIPPTGEHQNN
jgi:CheY-like chemotaxis protein